MAVEETRKQNKQRNENKKVVENLLRNQENKKVGENLRENLLRE